MDSQGRTETTPAQPLPTPQPGRRPRISGWLAYGTAGVLTDAEGRWSLDNVPADEEHEQRRPPLQRLDQVPVLRQDEIHQPG